jgi:hypothetical protein
LQPISGLLFSLFKGQPDHGPWVVSCLEGAWDKILGGKLAAVCRPVRLENSDLRIEIRDREWEHAFKGIKPALLEKLRAATANEVKTISFGRLSAEGSPQGAAGRRRMNAD